MNALRAAARPIPALCRRDLRFHEVEYGGASYQVVEDPVSLQYTRLREDQFRLLAAMDGTRSLQELLSQMKSLFPQRVWTLPGLQQAIADFHRKGLVVADRPGQGSVLRKRKSEEWRKKLLGVLMQPLSIKFPGIGTTPWLEWVYAMTVWLLHPVSLVMVAAVCLWAWTLLLLNLRDFEAGLPAFQQFFGWRNLSAMWLTLACAKGVHELGHAVVCRHFGAKCHEVGLMLLLLSPCLYCDVTDSWTLNSKWRRIAISAAGMGVEFVLSSLAILVWYYTSGGWWHHLALNLFFVTAVTTVVFNANPLMKLDGYYILSDWLEIPNLRARADKRLAELCETLFLGRDLPRAALEPEPPRWWFPLYAMACLAYLVLVMAGSLWFVSLLLRPQQLDSIGVVLAALMVGLMTGRALHKTGKSVWSKDKKPVKRGRLILAVGFLVALLGMVLSIPVPGWGHAACVVESHELREVRTSVPGRIVRVLAQPGERIAVGDVLVDLENPEIEQQGLLLRSQLATERVRREAAAARDDAALRALSEAALIGLEEQLKEQELAESRLTVRAPVGGVLVEPPPVEGEPQTPRRRQLGAWSGLPLAPDNGGAFLEVGTLVGVVAPAEERIAIAYLDQTQRAECEVGEGVSIRFTAHPLDLVEATVESLSAEEVSAVPASLSAKAGGPLATTTATGGAEQVAQVLYRARLRLPAAQVPVSDGMQGDVIIPLRQRSLAGWGLRWLTRTFRFEWI
ncbi:MAG: hypothetical protein C0478_09490 [Planctomyces sp.]|nr:hypothetical protein [Planctomyces sp.]